MTYSLTRLAAGNYDLVLNGAVIGSVVRSNRPNTGHAKWRAELAEDGSYVGKPHPFTQAEHEFGSLAEVTAWLGTTLVLDDRA